MKLLFRRKHDGRILKPIQTLEAHVRLHHEASDRVWWAKKDKLPENFDVLTHDIARGDVLRDLRDGQLWVVEHTSQLGLRLKSGILLKGMTYFGLVNYERVGRKYSLRDRQPHERVEFRKSQPAYATYDASKVMEPIRQATRERVNRFDAVTNAQRHAQEYGVGFIRVEPDGSMKAIDPRSVILK
ncbi:hypothetical protein [Escherichia phage vB_EcoS_bov15_1]|uniref:Uncharacterized protein n=1 Tax=Escherichia phage vb_EcoS_bov22_1 TaxID=2763527 RepID=A0AAE7JKN5_9CAUD|nr:hypothetical protein P9631_gp31 [Escherichia phage vb_EcoS_bov22_1]QNR53574.1 hypothetical protein [Escherichia phage vb_EcoS_bov11C2]QNR53648.1 hypothetical protein [Escherichia phage vb_EcoS_bov16_1]QNR53784.1 hypothetical protein [Escherichia phage vb_EcoS_bov25_1D]QOI69594.1 hypothetical protein [Escherichia phage vB_EcoS_bov15_1]QNR53697.1 hypothetical protein [Escherichia phage vb_EcoS_bov22_1]